MVTKQPHVSIVLVNWNGLDDTLHCLRSLRGLDYPDFDVVVVDNGSTDGSVDAIRSAASEVQVLEAGGNLGFAGGCNCGISDSLRRAGDYVWLLNPDTVVEPGALKAIVQGAQADPAIAIVGSVIRSINAPEEILAWGGGRVGMLSGRIAHGTGPGRIDYITGASMLVRVSVLREVGLFDERFFMYAEDADLCLRARRAGYRIAVAEESVVYHRESASLPGKNATRDRLHSESLTRFFRKHAPVPFIPILSALAARTAKRLLAGRPKNAWAIVEGVLRGLRQR